jgi:hypothetical protein
VASEFHSPGRRTDLRMMQPGYSPPTACG